MQAYRFDSFGSLDELRLRDEPAPVPQRGEVLVRVHAVSLNFRDLAMVRGRYPRPCYPGLIPTSDAAGEIVAVGEGVKAFKPGDRVMGAFHPRWFGGDMPSTVAADSYGAESDGWLCELKALSQEAVVPIPDSLSYEAACTLPCAGLTAWTALTGRTPIRAGHSVLIQGSGGVSIFALQLAKAAGATVIATSSSAEKLARLKDLGADYLINYKDDPAWGQTAAKLTGGRGVDAVVEIGGPGTMNQSLHASKIGGHISLIGVLTGVAGEIATALAMSKNITIKGVTVGSRQEQEEMIAAIEANGIKPVIDSTYPLDQIAAAFAHQISQKHFGKICLSI